MQRRGLLFGLGAAALAGLAQPVRAAGNDSDERIVALTFDDGPHPELTPRLLDLLASERVCATFYVIGSYAARFPEIVCRALDAGHEIGNHSWSHPWLTHLPLAQASTEISRTDALLQRLLGEEPNSVRPPYGAMDRQIEQLAWPRPMLLWDVDTLDWRHRNAAAVTRAATAGDGGIVLMHDIHPTTILAVPAIIRDFKERGFRFVTVSHYIEWNIRDIAYGLDLA